MNEDDIFDAFKAAQARGEMPTDLSSAELRELSAGVRANSVFTSRGTNAIFVSKLKEVINAVTAGEMDDATARWTLLETLRSLGYTPEGGFPETPAGAVPPAVKGSIQDLSSRRRLDLIINTQRDLMRGAGMQMSGMEPRKLAAFPCWELVRVYNVRVPRDWQARWKEAGGSFVIDGKFYGPFDETPWELDDAKGRESLKIRMIAPKGDMIWGELGSSENFDDALDVDYPPFAFNSGMGWQDVTAAEADRLGVLTSDGQPWESFLRSVERPRVMAGALPLPAPQISMRNVDPEIIDRYLKETDAVMVDDTATTSSGAEDLRARLDERAAAREERRAERMRRALEK